MLKLYIVIRATLPLGLKIAQAVHAQRAFVAEHPAIEEHWYRESNNIVCVEHLEPEFLADELEGRGLRVARFHEPDLDDQLTAFCVEPSAQRWLSSLPLAR